MPTVIITDGEQRASLALVRSLGRAGHRTVVLAKRPRGGLAGASHWADRTVRISVGALDDPGAFASEVARVVADETSPVLIPVTEASMYATLENAELFRDAILPLPTLDSFRAICDKAMVAAAAEKIGIAVPRQVVVDAPADSLEISSVKFPLVVKPSRSVSNAPGRRAKTAVSYASDSNELTTRLAGYSAESFPLLLQERVEGRGVGVFLLIWEGETIASFSHMRIREKPPSGGVSVLRESIPLDAELLVKSQELLRAFGWHGVAMIEYKVAADGTPYLMEINGRFWGSLQLAVDSGVDFPSYLVDLATGVDRRPEPGRYECGIRSRWLWGEIDHLLARLRRSPETLDLPASAPSRLRAVTDFATSFFDRRTNLEVLRVSDLRPFGREALNWMARRG